MSEIKKERSLTEYLKSTKTLFTIFGVLVALMTFSSSISYPLISSILTASFFGLAVSVWLEIKKVSDHQNASLILSSFLSIFEYIATPMILLYFFLIINSKYPYLLLIIILLSTTIFLFKILTHFKLIEKILPANSNIGRSIFGILILILCMLICYVITHYLLFPLIHHLLDELSKELMDGTSSLYKELSIPYLGNPL